MSRSNKVTLKMVKVKNPGDKSSLYDALLELAEVDNDFNGYNGEQYFWPGTQRGNFDSNAEWLANRLIKKYSKDETIVKNYIENWIGVDGYYADYKWDATYNNNKHVTAIALAFTEAY